MRMRFISFLILALVSSGLLACNSVEGPRASSASGKVNSAGEQKNTAATPQANSDGVQRITTSELKDLMDKGEAYVVDVRTEASFKAGHIRGAILIPTKDVASRAKELPRDKTIVTYCS